MSASEPGTHAAPAAGMPRDIRLARWALACAGLMWVLPFVQPLAWKPSTHFFPEWFAAVLGLGVCALLAGRRFTALPLESVALAALAAMLALQPLALTLPYVQPSVAHASLALWTAALMAAGHTLRATLGAAHCATTLAAWTATGASLAGLIGLLQHFGLAEALAPLVPPPDPGGTASGAIRHQSWFADHLVIGLAALAWLAARQTLPAVAALALALPMAAGVAVSGSRAPLLMLALGLGLGLAARWRLPAPWSRRLPLWQGLWLLLTLGLAWLLPRLAGGSAGTLTRLDTAYGDGAGLGSRMELWARAWQAFADAPWLGHGPDGYPWAAFRLAERAWLMDYTIHAHSLPLQLLATTGLAGGTALAVLVLLQWRGARAAAGSAEGWLFLGMLAPVALRSLLDLPTLFTFFLGPAALLTGLLSARALPLRAARLWQGVAATLVLAGLVLAGHTLHTYRDIASLWREPGQTLASLDARYRRARANPFLGPIADSIRADATPLERGRASGVLPLYGLTLRWRTNPRLALRYGAFLALAGREADACRWLARAVAVYPQSADGLLNRLTARSADLDPALARTRDLIAALRAGGGMGTACPPAPALVRAPR
jgi:O-antigen ligase